MGVWPSHLNLSQVRSEVSAWCSSHPGSLKNILHSWVFLAPHSWSLFFWLTLDLPPRLSFLTPGYRGSLWMSVCLEQIQVFPSQTQQSRTKTKTCPLFCRWKKISLWKHGADVRDQNDVVLSHRLTGPYSRNFGVCQCTFC